MLTAIKPSQPWPRVKEAGNGERAFAGPRPLLLSLPSAFFLVTGKPLPNRYSKFLNWSPWFPTNFSWPLERLILPHLQKTIRPDSRSGIFPSLSEGESLEIALGGNGLTIT